VAVPSDESTFPLWPAAEDLSVDGGAEAATEPVAKRSRGEASTPLRRGEVLGRYFILHELGRGGMGVVYAAFDPELDRKVALKILHPDRARKGGGGLGQARLLREAKALARLSHPNVIQVYDAGTVGDQVFVAMELAEGETLDAWLRRERRPWRPVLALFQAAGRGLAAAHAAGLLHRDFKPSNILLAADGRVRVLDFGIARLLSEEEPELPAEVAHAERGVRLTTQLTRAGVILGTPRYMAPEMLTAQRVDHRADQFAFCVALHEALYGIAPYAGETPLDLLAQITAGALREMPPGARVPAWIRRILLRGLAPDPEQRYPSMDELLSDLAKDRSTLFRRRAGAAAVLAVVAAGGLAFYGIERRQDRLCSGAEEKLAGIWDAGRKVAVRKAFLASGRSYAGDAWRGVERTLDAYTGAWSAMRTGACEATHLRGEQSPELLDLRMGCLDRRLREVRSLTDLFAAGDAAVVERAVQASQSLSGLADCADVAALTAPVRLPADPAARQAIERISGQIARARTLWTTGRYADGLPVAAAAVTAAARSGYAPVQAEALRMRSHLEESAGRSESAEASLFAALEAAGKGHHDALAARAWTDLVWMVGYRQRRFEEGRRWARLAEASLERLGGPAENPEIDADLKSNLGSVLDLGGDHEGGLALLRQSLALYEKVLGPDHPSVGRTLNRIGNAYWEMKRYDQALAPYQRALEHARRTLGPRHPTVAVRLGNIALIFETQGRYEESFATQLEALSIEKAALGPDHPRLAITHGNLSGLLLTLERPQEALFHAQRALAIDRANPDTNTADLGASLTTVADALFNLERYREALSYNRQARALLLPELGPNHPWSAEAETTHGLILYATGQPAEAVAPLRRAIAGFEAGETSGAPIASARFALAKAIWDSDGNRTQAIALAREARDGYARATPLRAKKLAEVQAWLAERD
jgi:eukaryotic-like serine/threonine-protein kinase